MYNTSLNNVVKMCINRNLRGGRRVLWCKKGEDIVSIWCGFLKGQRDISMTMQGSARCLHKDAQGSRCSGIDLCNGGENVLI